MDRYYRKIRDTWNNAGYQWNKWVVNYDSETQGELLNKLGFNNDKKYLSLALIMLISVGTLMAFYFWRLLPKRVKRSEAQQLYLKFLAAFKKYELDKKAHETPNEFSHRAREKFPQNESEITKITNTYIQIRYGKSPPDLDNFRQLVKKFKLNN